MDMLVTPCEKNLFLQTLGGKYNDDTFSPVDCQFGEDTYDILHKCLNLFFTLRWID